MVETEGITNNQDTIDSRDIIERIEYLEGMKEEVELEGDPMDEEEAEELQQLKALAEEVDGYSGWDDGVQLIRESYFKEYCQELCEDIGDIPKDLPWYIVVDWEATARHLRVDYTGVDFGEVTYLVR